jgi:hypothetical protein
MPRKEVYCENCGSNQPMVEQEPHQDELNPYPWYDITCGTCHSIPGHDPNRAGQQTA